MSLITRCPACETLFKVVPDQLRISEGWVRCGQCDEVFDASAHLVKDASLSPVPAAVATEAVPVPVPVVEITQGNMPAVTSQFLDLDLDFSEIEKTERPRVELDFGDAPALSQGPPASVDRLAPDAPSLAVVPQAPEAVVEPDAGHVAPDPVSSSPAEVSFLRTQSAESAWHRPLVRVGMSVLVLGLLLTLAGQFIFHERDRLAAHEPRLSPWLLAFCAPLGCSLAPVQRIEFVVIESSSFARVQDDIYRLSFTLRNAAATPLAMPAVELTLTDALDQPLMRRVVMPGELDALPSTLQPGLAQPVLTNFLVKLDAASQRMAGYRLLAFYP
jgi:predicted Zn finger-like uncharacterized protein